MEMQNAAAFGGNLRCYCLVDPTIATTFVTATKDTVIPPRDRVHQRRIVACDCVFQIFELWNAAPLTSMWAQIPIRNEHSRTGTCAINNQTISPVDTVWLLIAQVSVRE